MVHSRGTSAAAVDKQADYTIGTGADAKLVGETLAKWTDAADINPDYYDAAMVVTALGIFEGTDGAFNATKTFTRGAAATLLAKAYNTPKTWKELGSIYVSPFNDTADSYAANGAGWAYALGFMSGTNAAGTLFSPTREITVLEYTGMLVKMLGYTLTENYKVDIIRFASEAGLFNGFQVSDPSVKITFEQAAQITVNALVATRVTHDRNSYTGQNYDTYTKDRTALLASAPLQLSTIGGLPVYSGVSPTYSYSYAKLSNSSAVARDAFGYPGTALVGAKPDTATPTDLVYSTIAGFVPHYTQLASYTVGLNAAPTAGDPLTPGQIVLPVTYKTVNLAKRWLNGDSSGAIINTGATNALNFTADGTYVDIVEYTEGTTVKYAAIGILETLIDNSVISPYSVAIKKEHIAATGGSTNVFEIPVGSYALVTVPEPLSLTATNLPTTQPIITGKLITPEAVSVSAVNNKSLTYVSDGVSKTAIGVGYVKGTTIGQGTTYSVDNTLNGVKLNFIDGKVNVIVGDHGVVYYAQSAKISTWTADTATYAYILDPILYASATNLYNQAKINAAGNAGQKIAIFTDGTAKIINIHKSPVLNGNGVQNITNVQIISNVNDVFYEYTIQADGSYALFGLDTTVPTGGVAPNATWVAQIANATHVTLPSADAWKTDIGGATAITSYTTTISHIALPNIQVSQGGSDKAPKVETVTGLQNLYFPANAQLKILTTATKQFVVDVSSGDAAFNARAFLATGYGYLLYTESRNDGYYLGFAQDYSKLGTDITWIKANDADQTVLNDNSGALAYVTDHNKLHALTASGYVAVSQADFNNGTMGEGYIMFAGLPANTIALVDQVMFTYSGYVLAPKAGGKLDPLSPNVLVGTVGQFGPPVFEVNS